MSLTVIFGSAISILVRAKSRALGGNFSDGHRVERRHHLSLYAAPDGVVGRRSALGRLADAFRGPGLPFEGRDDVGDRDVGRILGKHVPAADAAATFHEPGRTQKPG